MSVLTTFRLADPLGNHLIEIADYESADYTLNCSPGGVGVLELTLPTSFDAALLLYHGRIGAWRSLSGRSPYLDGSAIFLVETFKYSSRRTWIRAYHTNTLLDSRIIAYDAGTSYTDKAAAAADDQIKTFWKENAGASIVAVDRDGVETQADISAYVSTQANLGQGASVAKAAARRKLLEVAKELAEASTTAGTYLTFEIVAPTESTLELRTYAVSRGVDRRASTASPVILSEQRGNLESAELLVDYHDQATFIVAGGSGEKADRLIATTFDATRAGLSPFGRIERFADMANVGDLTSLQDDADAGLRDARPLILFTGNLVETPAFQRGIHYDLGDMLTAEHPRTRAQFDVRLDVVREVITKDGRETRRQVQAGLRSVT
jgi:ReqiPepy6 Gp37-like protein